MKDQVILLFNALAKRYGQNRVLHHIEDQVDVAPIVVDEWMAGKRDPSSGIQKAVFNCLKNTKPEDFSVKRRSTQNMAKAKKPPTPPSNPSVKAARQKLIIEQNETAYRTMRENLERRGLVLKEVE